MTDHAQVTERHKRWALESVCVPGVRWHPEPSHLEAMLEHISHRIANFERRAKAEGALREHELMCCNPQMIVCPRHKALERELAEASK